MWTSWSKLSKWKGFCLKLCLIWLCPVVTWMVVAMSSGSLAIMVLCLPLAHVQCPVAIRMHKLQRVCNKCIDSLLRVLESRAAV